MSANRNKFPVLLEMKNYKEYGTFNQLKNTFVVQDKKSYKKDDDIILEINELTRSKVTDIIENKEWKSSSISIEKTLHLLNKKKKHKENLNILSKDRYIYSTIGLCTITFSSLLIYFSLDYIRAINQQRKLLNTESLHKFNVYVNASCPRGPWHYSNHGIFIDSEMSVFLDECCYQGTEFEFDPCVSILQTFVPVCLKLLEEYCYCIRENFSLEVDEGDCILERIAISACLSILMLLGLCAYSHYRAQILPREKEDILNEARELRIEVSENILLENLIKCYEYKLLEVNKNEKEEEVKKFFMSLPLVNSRFSQDLIGIVLDYTDYNEIIIKRKKDQRAQFMYGARLANRKKPLGTFFKKIKDQDFAKNRDSEFVEYKNVIKNIFKFVG